MDPELVENPEFADIAGIHRQPSSLIHVGAVINEAS